MEAVKEAIKQPEVPRQPTLEERFANAEALIESLRASMEKGLGTAFGKLGGIERKIASKPAPIKQESIDALRADGFEDHAAGLEWIRDLQVIQTVAEPSEEMVDAAAEKAEQRMHIRAVTRVHPDWREQVVKPEFQSWKSSQPSAIQQQLDNEWDASFINEKLTQFKASRQKPAPTPAPDATASTRKGRLAAAVTPRGTGATPTTNTGPDEFDEGFKTG
jgi:hypothetical protein